jgi:hypothetical protein
VWLKGQARAEWSGVMMESGTLIHPTVNFSGPPRSADMPPEVAALYDEASSVVDISPRSASVLLRLALQTLLEGLYPEEQDTLNKLIGAAVAAGLPHEVQKTMDLMRFNGNESAHEFHHDDTPETATTLFNLLNIVVERLITGPKQLDELYEGLPETFRQQVERRDKGSGSKT